MITKPMAMYLIMRKYMVMPTPRMLRSSIVVRQSGACAPPNMPFRRMRSA